MIWQQFLATAQKYSDRVAVCSGEHRLSYLELAGVAESLAVQLLPLGKNRPRRALIQQPDPLSVCLYVLACWRSGVTPVVVRETATRDQVAELETWVRPVACLFDRVTPTEISPRPPAGLPSGATGPREEGLVLSTSGTTGNPKLVVLPAESVCINAAAIGSNLGFTGDDRIVVNTPLTYMYGLMGGTMAGLWAGASVHLVSPRTHLPQLQALIRQREITVVQGPPSLMRLFLSYWNQKPFPSVRLVTTGGELVTAELVDALDRAFPAAAKRILYGMTEAGPRISHDDIHAGRYRSGCVGSPYRHIEWRIVPVTDAAVPAHVGRLVLRGPSICLGYLQASGEYRGVEPDGFFYSPDLVSTNDDGRLYFHGRLDRLFKSGGKLVNPAEIERVVTRFPGVRDARCRTEPHPLLGLVPVVDVVAEESHAIGEPVLREYCSAHLEPHTVPQRILFARALPMSHSGKTDRS